MSESRRVSNICLTIANLSRVGGEERMCSTLANGLCQKGFNVIIVSQNNYYWQKVFFHTDRKIEKYSLKRTLSEWFICRFCRKLEYDVRKYRRIVMNNHVDLVIDVDTELSLFTSKALYGLDVRRISWEHFCYERFSEREISSEIIRCLISDVDKLVVLTKADYYHFVNEAHIPASKVCQIYNPSPIQDEEYMCHNEKKVLSIGRLEYEKGIDLLLKVWSVIESESSDWTLEIVGEGSQKQQLEEMAAEMGLKRVIFSGFSKTPRVKYSSASIFVLPSRQEGFSLALVEAGNMGLPLVAFDCPNGPREIIVDGEGGFLISPDNIEAFASSLLRLINDSDLRESMGKKAYMSMDRFRLDNILMEWIRLLDSMSLDECS